MMPALVRARNYQVRDDKFALPMILSHVLKLQNSETPAEAKNAMHEILRWKELRPELAKEYELQNILTRLKNKPTIQDAVRSVIEEYKNNTECNNSSSDISHNHDVSTQFDDLLADHVDKSSASSIDTLSCRNDGQNDKAKYRYSTYDNMPNASVSEHSEDSSSNSSLQTVIDANGLTSHQDPAYKSNNASSETVADAEQDDMEKIYLNTIPPTASFIQQNDPNTSHASRLARGVKGVKGVKGVFSSSNDKKRISNKSKSLR